MIYGLRWRIEIIFKTWKSNMSFESIHQVSAIQLSIILLSRLIMIIILTQFIFSPCKSLIKKIFKKNLSLLKVTRYLSRNPQKIIEIISELTHDNLNCSNAITALARYCSYDKRKRSNYEQEIDALFPLS